MLKTLKIKNVKSIFNTERPVVVFEFDNYQSIVLTPKQALIAMHNGSKANEIPLEAAMSPLAQRAFIRARGCEISGDFTPMKAGDTYVPDGTHPMFTDTNHENYGKYKVGDSLVATSDSVYVKGLATIYPSEEELDREAQAEAMAKLKYMMSGTKLPSFAEPNNDTL